jgi:hypothetical protein
MSSAAQTTSSNNIACQKITPTDLQIKMERLVMKNVFIELVLFTLLDVLDVVLRFVVADWEASKFNLPVTNPNNSYNNAQAFDPGAVILWTLAAWTLLCHLVVFYLRLQGYLSQKNILDVGYANHWNTKRPIYKHRVLTSNTMQEHALSVEALRDYRLLRDDQKRKLRNSVAQTLDALLCSFPWILTNFSKSVNEAHNEEVTVNESTQFNILIQQASRAVAGISVGYKLISMLHVLEHVRKYRSTQILARSLIEERESLVITATSQSTKQNIPDAVNEAYTQLLQELEKQNDLQILKQTGPVVPHFVMMAVSAECKDTDILDSLQCMHDKASVVGLTSGYGLMTETGSVSPMPINATDNETLRFVSMFGVSDPDGLYISHAVSFEGISGNNGDEKMSAEDSVVELVQKACEITVVEKFSKLLRDDHWLLRYNMSRCPSFIWMNATTYEEAVIKGFHQVFGSKVVIVGGSAADRTFSGKERVYSYSAEPKNSASAALSNGVTFCVAWSSVETVTSFSSGFTETGLSGHVTKMGENANTLCEINGHRAGFVYDRWTGGMLLQKHLQNEGQGKTYLADSHLSDLASSNIGTVHGKYVILKESTPHPLGVRMGGYEDGKSYWKILHPSFWLEDNSIEVAAATRVGDEVSLMHGTRYNLIHRLSIMAKGILGYLRTDLVKDKNKNLLHKEVYTIARLYIAGILAVYCGGCAEHVGGKGIENISKELAKVARNVPFFGAFPYGEQGMWPNGQAGHGNLMFSLLVFTKRRLVVSALNVETGDILNEGEPDFELCRAVHPGLAQLHAHCQKARKLGATIMNRSDLNKPVRKMTWKKLGATIMNRSSRNKVVHKMTFAENKSGSPYRIPSTT